MDAYSEQRKNGGNKLKETEIREQVLALCEVLDNKKALDILAVNVADKTIIADWFIIASGRSTTQVKALCDELEEKAAERGLIARRKEGYQEGRWIVVDFGTILVHLFHPEEREYYNLERLWVDDPQHCINYSREHAE
ncbi:MAG: ribosome silencing factor [Clostridia bacterium]|jgi:ribosome-associated protein|nr:MAG: ribosome silencing factor [Clostridia bacterium]